MLSEAVEQRVEGDFCPVNPLIPDKSEALTGICGVPDTKTGPGVTL